jgi:hypothetical protein
VRKCGVCASVNWSSITISVEQEGIRNAGAFRSALMLGQAMKGQIKCKLCW